MLSTFNMLQTNPVERKMKWNDSHLQYDLRVFGAYHLTEVNVQSHRLELTLTRGAEVYKTSFMHPVPVEGSRTTISRSRQGEQERIQLKIRRAQATPEGYFPLAKSSPAMATMAG